ncbi:MAG: sigma-70 family RNA polymerase sigma factor [Planctomycetaceae bacterium]
MKKDTTLTHIAAAGIDMTGSQPPEQDPDLGVLFAEHRDRLRRMVQLRMDRRLQGRVDPSDVIQDAYMDATRRFDEYRSRPDVSAFVWLRFLTTQRLAQLHRHHLGVRARDAGREVSIFAGAGPEASSVVLAEKLVGRLTSPSSVLNRVEMRQQVLDALNRMDENDREILALRHFEQLDNAETAQVLQIAKQAAYKRYVRAIRRLKELLDKPGGWPGCGIRDDGAAGRSDALNQS